MKQVSSFLGIVGILLFMSCNSEPSLQEYFVDHQGDNDFISVDIPSSLLDKEKIEFSSEEIEALNSIKKINVLALPLKDKTKKKIEEEVIKIDKILSSDKYQTLMRFGKGGTKVVLKYQGNDDEIDELIVFAKDQDKGMALVRVLGNNMKPEKIAKLGQAMEKGKIDLAAFAKIAKVFNGE